MLKSIAITTQEILIFSFSFIPLLLFLAKKPKTITKGVIFAYTIGSIASDSLLYYNYYQEVIIDSAKVLRVFTLFEVVFFLLFFMLGITNKWIRILMVASFSIFLVAFFYTWNASSSQAPFDSEPASTSAIICILFSLIYLYHAASSPQRAGNDFVNSRFWFTIGIFIYMAGNLFMFVTYNSFSKHDAKNLSEIIFPLMNIMKNIFFSIGMLQKDKRRLS